MDNKKVSNLLRAVADLMDQTTEVVVETNKEVVKTVEKTSNDVLEHSLKLMKKIEENDAVRAYKNKLTTTNKKLGSALEEIQKLREKAVKDMMNEAKGITNPADFMSVVIKGAQKMGEHVAEEVNIMNEAVKA